MAIVINGSGEISGISVGGLPDGIVDAGTLATNSVDSAELIDGSIDNSHIDAMAASKLTGALPAIDGASLTGLSSFNPDAAVTINDSGADVDFRVETPNNAHTLYIDGGTDSVVAGFQYPNTGANAAAQFQVGAGLTFNSFTPVSSEVYDTGISINQGTAGMAMMLLASNHVGAGTATQAGQYFLKFYYDGGNAPVATHVAGDDCVTFDVSASDTLTVEMRAGGNSISIFTSG